MVNARLTQNGWRTFAVIRVAWYPRVNMFYQTVCWILLTPNELRWFQELYGVCWNELKHFEGPAWLATAHNNICFFLISDFTPGCVDLKDKCRKWADSGECQSNPEFMLFSCPMSCNTCSQCIDYDPTLCAELYQDGQCQSNVASMWAYCPKSCNLC